MIVFYSNSTEPIIEVCPLPITNLESLVFVKKNQLKRNVGKPRSTVYGTDEPLEFDFNTIKKFN